MGGAFVIAFALALASVGTAQELPGDAAGVRAPVSRARRYQMNARVRPLLFWIRRNDVGAARITWRGDPHGAHGYELLVGSDPLKAPRRINRWGYIAEDVSGVGATIVGVMTESNAESVEEAEQLLARAGQGGYAFHAIRATVSGEQAEAEVVLLRSEQDLTFRELEPLLARVSSVDAPRRVLRIPPATTPGFLCAVAALVRETVSPSLPPAGRRARPAQPRTYVYNGRLYDLTMRSLEEHADFASGGRRYGPALEAEFEAFNRTTRHRTKFSIVYGRAGELAGVPLRIVFRPKWWFEAELVLTD